MRHYVTIGFEIHGNKTDKEAIEEAEKIAKEMRDRLDNQAAVLSINETKKGKLYSRQVV